MSGFQRALPVALAVFTGVLGGYYTFQPALVQDKNLQNKATESLSPVTTPDPSGLRNLKQDDGGTRDAK
ncbi:hypothetical protein C2857_002249 [Epichloe festucae Fl1]|uniref:Uncharacterized protein n=1 Tax=Epichloe festucae (strain Fl1) TaxID=877507 RepID=A0A7S9KJZ1_EPIFF|nr:hypothetical protein C2857_002249 [Epichloe festucae Fl1]